MGGAVTGRVHRMTPQGGDIRCTRLGNDTFIFFSQLLVPPIAVRQVPVRLGERLGPLFFLWLSSAACRAPNPQSMAKLPLPIGAVTISLSVASRQKRRKRQKCQSAVDKNSKNGKSVGIKPAIKLFLPKTAGFEVLTVYKFRKI